MTASTHTHVHDAMNDETLRVLASSSGHHVRRKFAASRGSKNRLGLMTKTTTSVYKKRDAIVVVVVVTRHDYLYKLLMLNS